jgi:hypothetical protein
MKAQMMHVETTPGRVLVGPKKLANGYARIVSLKDGSGRIEKFDTAAGAWLEAPESVTFSEVWSAPPAAMMQLVLLSGKA